MVVTDAHSQHDTVVEIKRSASVNSDADVEIGEFLRSINTNKLTQVIFFSVVMLMFLLGMSTVLFTEETTPAKPFISHSKEDILDIVQKAAPKEEENLLDSSDGSKDEYSSDGLYFDHRGGEEDDMDGEGEEDEEDEEDEDTDVEDLDVNVDEGEDEGEVGMDQQQDEDNNTEEQNDNNDRDQSVSVHRDDPEADDDNRIPVADMESRPYTYENEADAAEKNVDLNDHPNHVAEKPSEFYSYQKEEKDQLTYEEPVLIVGEEEEDVSVEQNPTSSEVKNPKEEEDGDGDSVILGSDLRNWK